MARETGGGGRGAGSQRWATFVRNHAQAVVACDFCVAVTATFRVLYVFVAMEIGSRRLLHVNITSHPTAVWTVQQFRETLAAPHAYRFVLHDREHLLAVARRRHHCDGCPRPPDASPGANGERLL
jgi:hypothetical protein